MRVHLVEIARRPTADQVAAAVAFVERVSDRTGGRPLSDHLWIDLRSGRPLLVHVADESGTVAIAQVSAGNETSSLEVVVDPGIDREVAGRLRDDAASTAVDLFRHQGGGPLQWWLDDPDADRIAVAARLGLAPARSLHEMRRDLPAERRSRLTTRAFRPGADDTSWLEVNNRAFEHHAEQGGWTLDTLAARTGEPWFDADGFRILEADGGIAGFCWTKLHHELDPVTGEIYVIAVDPGHHGRGLGTELTLAGLDSISDRGVTRASLYVDAANDAAISLYHRLGFTIHRTRTACVGDLTTVTT